MRSFRRFSLYEHRAQPLLARPLFVRRVLSHGLASMLLVGASLALGVLGYHFTEGLSWIDSLLNASMILGGMGPVSQLQTTSGKLFASMYALFSGMVILVAAGLFVAPIAHRILHRLHIEPDAQESAES